MCCFVNSYRFYVYFNLRYWSIGADKKTKRLALMTVSYYYCFPLDKKTRNNIIENYFSIDCTSIGTNYFFNKRVSVAKCIQHLLSNLQNAHVDSMI